ncbi:MAG: hypothetical protein Q9160_003491 [Pyrenula sp. 1 TL-2023]
MAIRPHPTEKDTFLSCTQPFSPMTFAFGGHVYAQAAWAASRTVERGLVLHNISGHFILPGRLDVPFTYHVRRLRSGGIYSLRLVEVYQDPPPAEAPPSSPADSQRTPSFVATISFKRPELHPSSPSSSPLNPLPSFPISPAPPLKYHPFSHQTLPPSYLRTTYPILYTQPPASHPLAPTADFDWYQTYAATLHPHPDSTFPGVEMRKVDLSAQNAEAVAQHGVGAYRMLHLYRLIEPEESPLETDASVSASASTSTSTSTSETRAEDKDQDASWASQLNLSLSAHLYASDRNGLFLIARALGFGSGSFRITSLSHAVVFHADPDKLRMQSSTPPPTVNGGKWSVEGRTKRKWFVQEAWSSVSGGNRAMHESRLWSFDPDFDDGRGSEEVLATTWQEGMCRLVSREVGGGEGEGEEKGEGKERAERNGGMTEEEEKEGRAKL